MRRGLAVPSAVLITLSAALSIEANPVAADSGEIVGYVVRGVGNGHGRGLSQWGAFGRATDPDDPQSWEQILDTYYGGTIAGDVDNREISVRLTGWDNSQLVGAISTTSSLKWNDVDETYTALLASRTSRGWEIFGRLSGAECRDNIPIPVPTKELRLGDGQSIRDPDVKALQRLLDHLGFSPGPADGWFGNQTQWALTAYQQSVGLPSDGIWDADDWNFVDIESTSDESTDWMLLTVEPIPVSADLPEIYITSTANTAEPRVSAGELLGLCTPQGEVRHYRGSIEVEDNGGNSRVINVAPIEDYLKGVVPLEVSASWGDAANGRGMNALRAQAVAARSYALAENRNWGYATTCDTTSCQVYGGAARRSEPGAAALPIEQTNTNQAIVDTAGVVRIHSTSDGSTGTIARTEFSASNGPRTAGGLFPALDDPWDNVASNPLHRWSRIITTDQLDAAWEDRVESWGATYDSQDVRTRADATSEWDGIWSNCVVLSGTDCESTDTSANSISAVSFRNAFGLPSHGFEITPIRATPEPRGTFALIGDSVAESIAGRTSSSIDTSTLGRFLGESYEITFNNSLSSRPTVGTGFSAGDGVDVAQSVPVGAEVAVIVLGYNDASEDFGSHIDEMMNALTNRNVAQVYWLNLSTRRDAPVLIPQVSLNVGIGAPPALPDDNVRELQRYLQATGFSPGGVDGWFGSQTQGALVNYQQTYDLPADGSWDEEDWQFALTLPVARVYERHNAALSEGATRWDTLTILDWNACSSSPDADRWFSDDVHLTESGRIEFSDFIARSLINGATTCLDDPPETVGEDREHEGIVLRTPARLVDTRPGFPTAVNDNTDTPLTPGTTLEIPIAGTPGTPTNITGAIVNIAAVNPTGPGHLTAWPCNDPYPGEHVSILNYTTATTTANAAPIAIGPNGKLCIRTSTTTHIITDILGHTTTNN